MNCLAISNRFHTRARVRRDSRDLAWVFCIADLRTAISMAVFSSSSVTYVTMCCRLIYSDHNKQTVIPGSSSDNVSAVEFTTHISDRYLRQQRTFSPISLNIFDRFFNVSGRSEPIISCNCSMLFASILNLRVKFTIHNSSTEHETSCFTL